MAKKYIPSEDWRKNDPNPWKSNKKGKDSLRNPLSIFRKKRNSMI